MLINHLVKKGIFKEYEDLHYFHLTINDVMKIILKVNLGSEIYHYMTMYTHSENFMANITTPMAKILKKYF